MVAGKGAGAGAEPGVRATRHHPGVGLRGASPACCCGRCGCRGSRGPERSSCPEGEVPLRPQLEHSVQFWTMHSKNNFNNLDGVEMKSTRMMLLGEKDLRRNLLK
ncbi:hypothetical protein GRJ2_001623100 [Grus japonensis]|uniref:Uncharacterized protein n=1 Tax=Grus japonensis TaxID=30415 RepID=A0ABC9X1L2_GRUJA